MISFFSQVSPSVLITMAGIFGTLSLASVFGAWFKASRGAEAARELNQRIGSWWIMAGLFCVALATSSVLMFCFLGFVSFLGLKEYLSLIPTRRADRRVLLWAYLAIPAQFYLAAIGWYGMFIILIPVFLFALLPIRMILIGETEGFVRSAGTLQWGVMLCVFSISHAAFLLSLPVLEGEVHKPGPGLLLLLVLLCQGNDVFQYLVGKPLGRNKIAPDVSPGKTVEGFLGGVVLTTISATLLGPVLTPLDRWESTLVGLVIAVGGFFGDLCLSALKRDLGIKDTSTMIPGHGGVLDRIDSLCFAAPLFFHLVYYLKF